MLDKYDPYVHYTLLALRCAHDHRPAASVADSLYKQEVELLRPGTKIPHPTSISKYIKQLHATVALNIQEYFKVNRSHFGLHYTD